MITETTIYNSRNYVMALDRERQARHRTIYNSRNYVMALDLMAIRASNLDLQQ